MSDPTPKAADAALFANSVTLYLLAASGPDADKAQRRSHLIKAFQSYAALQDRMRELEALAPNCKQAGYDNAATLREVAGGGH